MFGDTGSQPSESQNSEVSQLAGASLEQTRSRESESTHEAAQHSGSLEAIPPNTITDSLLRVDGITYDYLDFGAELKDEDLGPLYAEVNRHSTGSTTVEQAASNEVPLYAVKGYDPSFRVAKRTDYGPVLYEVLSNPRAEEGSDVLDIGGKVRGISIAHMLEPIPAGQSVGHIEDSEKAERLDQSLMGAPIKPTSPDYYGTDDLDQYHVSFYLKDGTFVSFEYRMDTGRLSKVSPDGLDIPASGIVASQAFREAIEDGVDKRYQRLIEAEKVQRGSCSDTRTSQVVRRVNSEGGPLTPNGEVYTTNDVDPSGPWGGVLRGTGKNDKLRGEGGEDKTYDLGGDDAVEGGACDDEIYGGPGNDNMVGDQGYAFAEVKVKSGKDVLYGEDGNDTLFPDKDGQRDELYCGKGYDKAMVGSATADKIDYVDDSCEEKEEYTPIVP
jgi:hypothetical protein